MISFDKLRQRSGVRQDNTHTFRRNCEYSFREWESTIPQPTNSSTITTCIATSKSPKLNNLRDGTLVGNIPQECQNGIECDHMLKRSITRLRNDVIVQRDSLALLNTI